MTIITRERSERYAIVPNAVADDDRLSFEARGMLLYLLAKPNNWQVSIHNLRRAGNIGRDKVYRILNELIGAGYITRRAERNPDGSIAAHEYVVYDDPVPDQLPFPENPEVATLLPDNPELGQPLPEKPGPVQPEAANQDGLISTHPTNTLSKKYPSSNGAFSELWEPWAREHRPDSRAAAEAIFINLPAPIDRYQAIEHAAAYRRLMVYRGTKPLMIRYLKEKWWRVLAGAPPYDKDGDFIITPEREEWGPWLDALRATHGDVAVASAKRLGKLLRADRWPDPGVVAKAQQLTMQMEAAHG
jgi:hypothetical protein